MYHLLQKATTIEIANMVSKFPYMNTDTILENNIRVTRCN